MKTDRQTLGAWAERQVARSVDCPKCKRPRTLQRLPNNFKCADLICDFCGYLAQVKAVTTDATLSMPSTILGAAWGPQKERMDAGIYFPLFIVLKAAAAHAIYYLPTDLQGPEVFQPRNPLSAGAKKAGWQGFRYALGALIGGSLIRFR